MDMDDSAWVLIILGRSFLVIVGAVIDLQTGILSFQLCGEILFSLPTPSLEAAILSPHVIPCIPSLLLLHLRSRYSMEIEDLI